MFQSRPSLLAQPLIRLSAFKPSLGEDKIEFAGDKDREKSGGWGDGGGDEAYVYVYPPKPGQVLGSLEARAGKTAVFLA